MSYLRLRLVISAVTSESGTMDDKTKQYILKDLAAGMFPDSPDQQVQAANCLRTKCAMAVSKVGVVRGGSAHF